MKIKYRSKETDRTNEYKKGTKKERKKKERVKKKESQGQINAYVT
jgi:hypothetical protein